mmetsp:Transcript_49140/g.60369  ORF Transcript_49140/g.60369 Transcript_49140/m.60369 type:complete len:324 (-) Transcript_49140:502-1473(-)
MSLFFLFCLCLCLELMEGKRKFIDNYFDKSLIGPYVEWVNDPLYQSDCEPRINTNTYLPGGVSAYLKCATFNIIYTYNERIASSIINTVGYHHFRISFNIVISDGREQDSCGLYYSLNGGINYQTFDNSVFNGNEFGNGYKSVIINTEDISNTELLKLRFEFSMTWPAVSGCWINNLTMTGIEITNNPTSSSIPSSINPTNIPTPNPSIVSPQSTNIPTLNPSNKPLHPPTILTTTDKPTIQPTSLPTNPTPNPTPISVANEAQPSTNVSILTISIAGVSIIVTAIIVLMCVRHVKQRRLNGINNANNPRYNAMDRRPVNPEP